MATPKGGYYLNGKRLPSTTTILNRLDDQSGLIFAAVKLARQGKDYNKEWGAARLTGTAVHTMAELYLEKGTTTLSKEQRKELGLTPDMWEHAKVAFKAFLHWAQTTNLKKPEQELSLISDEHRFGGTFDCLYKGPDGLIVCDWKTSKDTRMSHLYQLASYGILVAEHYDTPIAGYYLVRLDKESGTFEHIYYPELDAEREVFIQLTKCHHLMNDCKRRRKLK